MFPAVGMISEIAIAGGVAFTVIVPPVIEAVVKKQAEVASGQN
jgi:hypothetical protein